MKCHVTTTLKQKFFSRTISVPPFLTLDAEAVASMAHEVESRSRSDRTDRVRGTALTDRKAISSQCLLMSQPRNGLKTLTNEKWGTIMQNTKFKSWYGSTIPVQQCRMLASICLSWITFLKTHSLGLLVDLISFFRPLSDFSRFESNQVFLMWVRKRLKKTFRCRRPITVFHYTQLLRSFPSKQFSSESKAEMNLFLSVVHYWVHYNEFSVVKCWVHRNEFSVGYYVNNSSLRRARVLAQWVRINQW